jgi:hypothetical protein
LRIQWRGKRHRTFGLATRHSQVAFVLETTDPAGDRRLIEVVFLADERDRRTDPRGRVPWSGGIEGVVVNLSDGAGAGR